MYYFFQRRRASARARDMEDSITLIFGCPLKLIHVFRTEETVSGYFGEKVDSCRDKRELISRSDPDLIIISRLR